jgi:molybdopterin-containing oxidoreductase family iron-sulfur binding subunit
VSGHDGTASIIQPLIAPLYAGWSEHELLAELIGEPRTAYDLVREHWRSGVLADDFENRWEAALREGFVADTQATPLQLGAPTSIASLEAAGSDVASDARAGSALHVLFRPDPTIWDGRFANNGWLQELPKPFTKLTWDNAALISPATAERLGASHGRLVRLARGERQVVLPVLILPGQADDTITVHFGYGRQVVGQIGERAGFDVYPLRTSDALWHAVGVEVQPTADDYRLAITQGHFQLEGRDLVRAGTLQTVRDHADEPPFMHTAHAPEANLLGEWEYNSYKWAMAIDLTACTGCNACVTACQAENNIPIVGKEEVARAREMHWLRIDTYFDGDAANPGVLFQPLACVHCEKAPCEVVCPVAATTHSDEGLNEMTYNRCVGTRYCSNNCPYKVRRFNFLQYADLETPVLKLLRNPNVTVRTRGVMEKCTYCVQRINGARRAAGREDRTIRADEIETACQAACPTRAIVFGDLNNAQSTVVRWKQSPLDYGLLADLNTQPRTSYLAAVRNPHPAIKEDTAT